MAEQDVKAEAIKTSKGIFHLQEMKGKGTKIYSLPIYVTHLSYFS